MRGGLRRRRVVPFGSACRLRGAAGRLRRDSRARAVFRGWMRRAVLILIAGALVLASVVATAAGQVVPGVALLFLGVVTASPLSLPSLPGD